MFCLQFDDCILKYEKKQQWKDACEHAFLKWELNKACLNNVLCAGTEIWYALLIQDQNMSSPFPNTILDFCNRQRAQYMLSQITQYAFSHFEENPAVNAYFGYMMNAMPFYFLDYNGNYDGWRKKGQLMMRQSYILSPQSLFSKAMFYLSHCYDNPDSYSHFLEACNKLWTSVPPNEWGYSEVQQYFRHILNGSTEDGLGDKHSTWGDRGTVLLSPKIAQTNY